MESIKQIGAGMSGVNSSYLAVFADSTRGIFKPVVGESKRLSDAVGGPLWKREIAAYQVDQLLKFDIVPETTAWNWKVKMGEAAPKGIGSLQRWIDDVKLGFNVTASEKAGVKSSFDSMKVFDYLIDNHDRHGANWLLDYAKNRVAAIDNGASFIRYRFGDLSGFPPKTQIKSLPKKIKDKILSTTNAEIRNALGELLEDYDINNFIARFDSVKAILLNEAKKEAK